MLVLFCEEKMRKPSTSVVYKCSKCHKKGHSTQACGKTCNFQTKKASNFAGTAKKKSTRSNDELSQIHKVYAGLQEVRSDAVKTSSNDPWAVTENLRSAMVERCVELLKHSTNGFKNLHVTHVKSCMVQGWGNGMWKLYAYRGEDSGWQYFDTEKEPFSHVRKEGFVVITQNDSGNNISVHTLNERGYLHSFNGNPALVEGQGFRDFELRWCHRGVVHNLEGPAQILIQSLGWVNEQAGRILQHEYWWAKGYQSFTPSLCEEASRGGLTDEKFYELCTHKDYVVRQVAANNPTCPPEWQTMVRVLDG